MHRQVPRLQHLEPHRPERVVDRLPVVDHQQAPSQLDVGLDLQVVGVLGVEAVGHGVLVSGELRARFQQTEDFAVDADLVRGTASRLYGVGRVE